MNAPTITFRGKPYVDAAGQRRLKVPKLARHHCDMHAFRTHRKFGTYSNSDLFLALLRRRLSELQVPEYLVLDDLPACVTVDDSGFLAKVTIAMTWDDDG